MKRKRFKFTPEQLELLKEKYPETLTADIALIFDCSVYTIYNAANRLGLRKNIEFVRDTAADRMADLNHGGRKHQFGKGHSPANKGRKQAEYMDSDAIARSRATCFKKGHTPANHRPIGYERINKDGYIEVKIKEPNVFRAKHRIIWEQHNGKIAPGCNIQFKDGNRLNCAIDNLYLITRGEQMKDNSGSLNLPDGMVAAYLAGSRSTRDKALVEELKKYPELLEIKRKQLLLNREIKKNGSGKSNTDTSRNDR